MGRRRLPRLLRSRRLKLTAMLVCIAAPLFCYSLLPSRAARLNAALLDAVRRDDVATMRSLLRQGADPDTRELPHPPAIMWTSIRAFATSIRSRLSFKPGPGDGRTVLFLAAMRGRPEEVKALLAAGADPNCQNSRETGLGVTPLIGAIQKGDIFMAQHLLDNCACVSSADMWRMTPLDWATKLRNKRADSLLRSKGAEEEYCLKYDPSVRRCGAGFLMR